MSDLDSRYEQNYAKDYGIEGIFVKYRRKMVLESIHRYPAKRFLEIGCGIEPLFEFVSDYDSFSVVELNKPFADSARKRAAANGCRSHQSAKRTFDS